MRVRIRLVADFPSNCGFVLDSLRFCPGVPAAENRLIRFTGGAGRWPEGQLYLHLASKELFSGLRRRALSKPTSAGYRARPGRGAEAPLFHLPAYSPGSKR